MYLVRLPVGICFFVRLLPPVLPPAIGGLSYLNPADCVIDFLAVCLTRAIVVLL